MAPQQQQLVSAQQQLRRAPPPRVAFVPPFANLFGGGHSFKFPWEHGASGASGNTSKLKVDFSGTWVKDKGRSDSLDEAIKLMALSGVMRQAVKLIKGVEVKQQGDLFVFSVVSVIPWFKLSETYKMSGEPAKCRRRDFRRGGHVGTISVPTASTLKLSLTWPDPHGGSGEDVFSMPSPDRLVIDQVTRAKGPDGKEKEVRYKSVYNRKK